MASSDAARRNHDAPFPNHRSTLKVTDPALVEVFDNWALDEVIQDAPLKQAFYGNILVGGGPAPVRAYVLRAVSNQVECSTGRSGSRR